MCTHRQLGGGGDASLPGVRPTPRRQPSLPFARRTPFQLRAAPQSQPCKLHETAQPTPPRGGAQTLAPLLTPKERLTLKSATRDPWDTPSKTHPAPPRGPREPRPPPPTEPPPPARPPPRPASGTSHLLYVLNTPSRSPPRGRSSHSPARPSLV